MRRPDRLLPVLLWAAAVLFLMRSTEIHPAAQTRSGSNPEKFIVPKIWDSKQLATWATPVAGVNATPNFYSEEEYYAAPIDNLRTYPVYAPDKEPKGYREWMLKQGPQRLIEPEKLKTERDWVEAGRAVFAGLDFPVTRTDNPQLMKFLSDADAVRKGGDAITKDGIIPAIRWCVDRDGKLKVALADCSGCHSRIMPDGAKAKDYPGSDYDLVAFFDSLHDMGDPVGAAAHVLSTLKSDGSWMIVEPFANDRIEDNLNLIGRIFYSASTMLCTPASRSQEVGLGLGAQAGEARIRDVATSGGFSRFRRASETPFNLVFEARP